MSNKIKDIDIKNHTYYFFDDIINIKNFDTNKIKIDEKSNKNILIYCIGYVTIKDLKYVEINSANPLYLIINKVNGYFEEINKKKYLSLVHTDESKEKKYEEMWTKTRDLIMSITKNSDEELSLNKTIETPSIIIAARAVFHENNKYYPPSFPR